MIHTIRKAMADGTAVEFEYDHPTGRRIKRVVRPIRFMGSYRILALCLVREKERQFELSRIRNCQPYEIEMTDHLCPQVNAALRQLQDALCQWERNTGRESILIFREARGNIMQEGPLPSAYCLRLANGVSVDPENRDLPDDFLLRQFTDSMPNKGE